MRVFEFDREILRTYSRFCRSFTSVRAADLAGEIAAKYDEGEFWPDPLLSLNPSYESGPAVDELCSQGVLSPETATIFRIDGAPIRFHRHQAEAISRATQAQSFVVTTGTGSGKSLCFFVPIVDRILRARQARKRPRTRAIIVYPMNALANSQLGEIEKFVGQAGMADELRPTVGRYTGQDDDQERKRIAAEPPDILLTNFMMLELLLTRQDQTDRRVIANCDRLEFIVLDELHTYRGRQGADVAILVRRLRDRCCRNEPAPVCIGTSATMISADAEAQPREAVARVSSRIFGTEIPADAVITEELRRSTDPALTLSWARPRLRKVLETPLPSDLTNAALERHPLAVWIELELGLDEDDAHARRAPVPWSKAVAQLAGFAGVSQELAQEKLTEFLGLAAQPESERGGSGSSAFMAFKLHRFISGAGDVRTTLKPRPRPVHLEGQRYDPDDPEARLYPTRFCLECGQEYHVVHLQDSDGDRTAVPRSIDDTPSKPPWDGETPGYLTPHEPAGASFRFSGAIETFPEDWLQDRKGTLVLRDNRKPRQPREIQVRANGRVGEPGEGEPGELFWFVPGRFGFCLACGDQPAPQARERNKLGGLSAEGRSSATTTIVKAMLSVMNAPESEIAPERRKTLGFTDNRQDAALQAGHFNDSVFITLLRGAILRSVLDAGSEGLRDDGFGGAVQRALRLVPENEDLRTFWMANPDVKGANRLEAGRTLARVLEHRVWADMRRGWRFTYPNLFGVHLLEPDFLALDELVADEDVFRSAPPALAAVGNDTRRDIAKKLLDAMLERLAVATSALDPTETDPLKNRAKSLLCTPWTIDGQEDLRSSSALVLEAPPSRSQSKRDDMLLLRAGPRSGLARALNRTSVLKNQNRLNADEYSDLMGWLLEQLAGYGILAGITTASDLQGWQIQPSVVRLLPGPAVDNEAAAPNDYFRDLYLGVADELRAGRSGRSVLMGMESREHTAQVTANQREWREWRFRFEEPDIGKIESNRAEMVREGEGASFLPTLFCSPTMELGVDIAALNAVYLRNVPPTPANYAQRAGRAGRSGQTAAITTYCAAQSPHDQYFFHRTQEMVAGSVRPPAIDLANEELVRAHLHAVWLAETGEPLSANIPQVLDLEADGLPVRADILTMLADSSVIERAHPAMMRVVATLLDHFDGVRPDWLCDEWVAAIARQARGEFDEAFTRWRGLYSSAHAQQEETQQKLQRPGLSLRERRRLDARARAASQQIGLLENGQARSGSDFYTYRYLATEGFLPGYDFPRLPLYAFVPGRRADGRPAFLQRPRFLAISEFGPRSLIYHEGRAFRVHKAKLTPGTVAADGRSLVTGKVFICPDCGGAHDTERERCHACDAPLKGCRAIQKTLRIDSVETLPTERITSNDEERVRQGFEIQTVFSWPVRDGVLDMSERALFADGEPLLTLQYANSAHIMRLNLGLKRRSRASIMGFPIDPSTGRWARLEDEVAEEKKDPDRTYPERIVPVVHDRKNSLLLRFSSPETWSGAAIATAQHALLRGIEIVFQLEEGEVLGEPLPDRDNRRAILLYEAAEGGAGVLGRVMRDEKLLQRIVREALSLMHYEGVTEAVATGNPRKLSDDDTPCVAGCYRCLLSYYNQLDHELIDRRAGLALVLLLELATAQTVDHPTDSRIDPWLQAFGRSGLKPPDAAPMEVDGTPVPYVWRGDLQAALVGPVPQALSAALESMGFDLHELPADPSAGVPADLAALLNGTA